MLLLNYGKRTFLPALRHPQSRQLPNCPRRTRWTLSSISLDQAFVCSDISGSGGVLDMSVPVRCSFRSSSDKVMTYARKSKNNSLYFWGYLGCYYKNTKEDVTSRKHRLISTRLPNPVFLHSHHALSAQYESSGRAGFSSVSQAGRTVGSFLTTSEPPVPFPFHSIRQASHAMRRQADKNRRRSFRLSMRSSVGASSKN
jgi:hypothetical protein